MLAIKLSEGIKARLQEAGYREIRTRRRELDLVLNFAVLAGCFYWLRHLDYSTKGDHWLWIIVVLNGFIFWGGAFLLLLGPTVWFTGGGQSPETRRRVE